MITDYSLDLVLAAKDIGRARTWYDERLGWEPIYEGHGVIAYRPFDTDFTIYETPNAGTAKSTVAVWSVRDLRSQVAQLQSRGLVFEEYRFSDEYRTVDGIMTDPRDGSMNAWFKDADGSIWSVLEIPGDDRPSAISPMIAASNLARADAWYREHLGVSADRRYEEQVNVYSSGGKSFSIYQTQFAGTAKNTVAGWEVKDLRAEVTALVARGVTFEDYDFPGLKTADGVASDPAGILSAWFADSEGNILVISETAEYRLW